MNEMHRFEDVLESLSMALSHPSQHGQLTSIYLLQTTPEHSLLFEM